MIKGKKVILRPVRKIDFPLLHKWINDPEIARFWYGQDKPRSQEWIEKHFTPMVEGKSESSCWIIEAEKALGFMYNTPQKEDDGEEFSGRVELDIMIGDSGEQGKGYGTDALRTMINYAFKKQKAERVFIMPRSNNKRAIHVYEKAGFKVEGTRENFNWFGLFTVLVYI